MRNTVDIVDKNTPYMLGQLFRIQYLYKPVKNQHLQTVFAQILSVGKALKPRNAGIGFTEQKYVCCLTFLKC